MSKFLYIESQKAGKKNIVSITINGKDFEMQLLDNQYQVEYLILRSLLLDEKMNLGNDERIDIDKCLDILTEEQKN